MTTIDYSAVSAALQKEFEPDIVSQINRQSPLLQVLRGRPPIGPTIQWDVQTGTADGAVGATAEGADASTFNTDDLNNAVLSYKTYTESFEVTGLALSTAAQSMNPRALSSLFQWHVEQAGQRLAKKIAGDVYTADGTSNRVDGLLGLALLATGTYAGIVRGSVPQWAGNEIGNGAIARDLSFPLLRSALRTVRVASGVKPSFMVCGPATHEAFGNLYDDLKRYTMDMVTVPGVGPIALDGGYTALSFDRIPLVDDVNCPEGKIVMLNLDTVYMRQLPSAGADIPLVMGTRNLSAQGINSKQSIVTPIRVRVQALGPAGDKFRFQLVAYLNVQVTQPNANGILEDLNYPS